MTLRSKESGRLVDKLDAEGLKTLQETDRCWCSRKWDLKENSQKLMHDVHCVYSEDVDIG